jgi:hypothetical protein
MNDDGRLELGDKWLVWQVNGWLVLQRPYGKKNNRTLYSGDSLSEALKALKGDN